MLHGVPQSLRAELCRPSSMFSDTFDSNDRFGRHGRVLDYVRERTLGLAKMHD